MSSLFSFQPPLCRHRRRYLATRLFVFGDIPTELHMLSHYMCLCAYEGRVDYCIFPVAWKWHKTKVNVQTQKHHNGSGKWMPNAGIRCRRFAVRVYYDALPCCTKWKRTKSTDRPTRRAQIFIMLVGYGSGTNEGFFRLYFSTTAHCICE